MSTPNLLQFNDTFTRYAKNDPITTILLAYQKINLITISDGTLHTIFDLKKAMDNPGCEPG